MGTPEVNHSLTWGRFHLLGEEERVWLGEQIKEVGRNTTPQMAETLLVPRLSSKYIEMVLSCHLAI